MRSPLLTTALAASLALGTITGPVLAGSIAEPVLEPEIIVQQSSSSVSHHILPPAMFVAFVLAGMLATPALLPSDQRLKTDITRVGTAANGLPLYHFRYIGQPQVYEGVMAQDVLRHTPEAVREIGSGYLGVDYGMLGLQMRAVN